MAEPVIMFVIGIDHFNREQQVYLFATRNDAGISFELTEPARTISQLRRGIT